MKFEEWEKWYNKILNDFNFSREDDEKSSEFLNKTLEEEKYYPFEELKEYVNNLNSNNHKPPLFIVFGAGPSLKKDIQYIKDQKSHEKNYIIIAADGATTALLEEKIIPDIIVTDLDGKIDDLLLANKLKSFFVIHGHGHNQKAIDKYLNNFEKVLPTTQSKPYDKLYNFGGFTDGDRAVFLAVALGAKKIVMGGMDFGKITTKYSRPNIDTKIAEADEIKQKKLEYAEKLIDWISENKNIDILNLSPNQKWIMNDYKNKIKIRII